MYVGRQGGEQAGVQVVQGVAGMPSHAMPTLASRTRVTARHVGPADGGDGRANADRHDS